MGTVRIEATDQWRIDSHGNGAAYTILHVPSQRSGFVQYGDDAARWREDYDAMQEAYSSPNSCWYKQTWNACLAELCGDYLSDGDD